MKKSLILFISFVLYNTFIIAQNNSEEQKENSKSNKNDFAKKFFIAFTTSTYTDILITPLKLHWDFTGNTDNQGNKKYDYIPYQSMQTNIVSIGFEPRYNLKEFDENNSFSVSIPFSFGLGSSYSAANDDLQVKGNEGFGSLQFPILFKYNTGNGATYKTQKDFGFNIGAGVEFSKVGIINMTATSNKYNKFFALPCATLGFVMMRGDSPMEINLKYALGKLTTQTTDTQGLQLTTNRVTRAQTLKLSFIYLLNY
ncbi:MAG: hypothetical protein HUU47_01160 [Bacteroidetes bacterium]|nr:hypothetical protein [Bacteroidota bacterium]